ncbi:hypothetical protein [Rubinisphaera margarita]|nr:hypothetical protein [Rubinisphaera margarita]
MEKKHKAQEKLKRRLRRKNSPSEIIPPVPDEAELDITDDET